MIFLQHKYSYLSAIFIAIIGYVLLGYFIPRENFNSLFFVYSILFAGFYILYNATEISEKQLFKIGILFRVLLLFGLPFWSQDFYRFIWDGRLILAGISPYEHLPNDIIQSTSIFQADELFNKMGSLSAQHYSNYPPINQLFFAIASFFGSKSIFVTALILKISVIFGDIGMYHFGKKILVLLNQNPRKIFLYFLNPLIIIELTGNLHFEGVMMCFFVMGLYYFFKEKWMFFVVFISLSISTKLLPLLLLPFLFQRLRFKKSLFFYSAILALNILFFLPFLSNRLIHNYTDSIALWFVTFEFNASFYYIFREIGYYVKGYNAIGTIGKIIPLISISVLLYFALVQRNIEKKSLLANGLFALTIYFLLSTTVHPWYIVSLVVLTLFTNYKYPIVWSYLVVLSYFAYSQSDFKESYILLSIEYLLVIGFFIYEVFFNRIEMPIKD